MTYLFKKLFLFEVEIFYVLYTDLKKRYSGAYKCQKHEILVSSNDDLGELCELAKFWCSTGAIENYEIAVRRIKQRYYNGDKCLYVRCHGNIVGWSWLGFTKCEHLGAFAKKLGLKKDEAIAYDSYVLADYRRLGIHQDIQMYRFSFAHEKYDINKLYTYIGANNIESLYNALRNYEAFLVFTFFRIHVYRITIDLFPGFSQSGWRSAWYENK